MRSLVWFCLVGIVLGQDETTTEPEASTNDTLLFDDADLQPIKKNVYEETLPQSETSENKTMTSFPNVQPQLVKNRPEDSFIQPEPWRNKNLWFHPISDAIRPLSDAVRPLSDAVTNFVTLTKHPNYGGVQLLNPINLWQKLHQKASSYFTGPYGATFGTAFNGPLDYPFAYRKTKNSL